MNNNDKKSVPLTPVCASHVDRLVNCERAAIAAIELLAKEFLRIGAPHYARMVIGQTKAISGAVIATKNVIRDRDS